MLAIELNILNINNQMRSEENICRIGETLLFWLDVYIKNPIFKKYTEKEDHYKNGPSFISTLFWKKMVDKWMDGDWGWV